MKILTKTFAHFRVLVDENFGGQDVTERQKGGCEVAVGEFLWEVVDKEVAAFRT